MFHVLRVACGMTCGLVAIFFLFLGVVGVRQGHASSGGVVLGLGAIAGAIAYYLLSPRGQPIKRRKRASRRDIALPQAEDIPQPRRTTRAERSAPQGWQRYFDPATWDFDLAKVTAAGWIFGLTSVACMFALLAICIFLFNLPSGGHVPRWITNNRWIGGVLLAPITAWFIFGAKVMKSLGYPVFRNESAKPPRPKPNVTPLTNAGGGTLSRRSSGQGLPPRRRGV